MNISRVYSFTDSVPMLPSQVETEFFNIISALNNFDQGIFKHTIVSIAEDGALIFTSADGTKTTTFEYVINQFQIIADSGDGLVILGNFAVCKSGNPSYGDGVGVFFVNDAQAVPSGNPTGGIILYSDGGSLKARGANGGITVVAPAGIRSVAFGDTPYSTATGDYHILVDATSGPVQVDLPLAASHEARTLHIKKIDASANAVTVSRVSSDDIEGSNTYSLATQFKSVTLYSGGGVRWFILSST